MKKFSKFISATLSVLLLVTLVTGCGAPAASSAAPTSPSSGSSEGSAASSSAPTATIGTPDKPVNVTYLCKDRNPTDPDVVDYCAQLSKNLAAQGIYVTLEIIEAPAGTYGEVVPLAVRNGEIAADIVYFQGGDLPVAEEGILEDLTPYIEKSTHVKSLLQPFSSERMKNYPYLLYLSDVAVYTPVLRGDLYEKLPTAKAVKQDPTIDNYYAMFKEIVSTGAAKYAITMDGGIARLDSIFNHAFGVSSTIMQVDGKWVFGKATQFERDKLEFYAKLYKEGLIDPEYITKKWDTMEQSFYSGDSAMLAGTCGAVIDVYNNKVVQERGDAAALVVLPPAKGAGQSYASIDTTKESRGRSILADSPNKDAAWAVMEYMCSPEGRVLDLLGVEGIHYNIENNQLVRTERGTKWWNQFFPTVYNFESAVPLAKPLMGDAAAESLELAQKYAKNDINIIIPTDLAAQWDAMNSLYKDYSSDIIRGIKPISAFDEFVAKWNAAGGDQFSEYLATVLK